MNIRVLALLTTLLVVAGTARAAQSAMNGGADGHITDHSLPGWMSDLVARQLGWMGEAPLAPTAGRAAFRAIWWYPDHSMRVLRLEIGPEGRVIVTVKYQDRRALVASRRGRPSLTRKCVRPFKIDPKKIAAFGGSVRTLAAVSESSDEVMVGGTLYIVQSATDDGQASYGASETETGFDRLPTEWNRLAESAGCHVPSPVW